MKPAPDKLLDEAMKLPARARARLAARLLESLELGVPARTPEEWSAAWSVEVARRLQSIEEGALEPVPWEQVRRELTRGVRRKG